MEHVKYVLITAAHNEEDFIEATINSVISQHIKPSQWIIVSDRSTDRTEEIVNKYVRTNGFIKLICITEGTGRDFAAKVHAIKTGYENLDDIDYDYIGILDSDITFESDYFKRITQEFILNSNLGIAGGGFIDIVGKKRQKIIPTEGNVRGAAQLFRKKCFNDIDGLYPLKYGGEDGIACFAARMHNWEVKTFEDIIVLHHRRTGTASSSILKTRFKDGLVDYNMGYHPAFHFIKCVKRISHKPFFIGSLFRLSGFIYGSFKNEKKVIPPKLVDFIQNEQKKRLFGRSINHD